METLKKKKKERIRHRTTELLIRHIVFDLNRKLSAPRIAWLHQVSSGWVNALAKKLRKEGFKIPDTCPTKTRFTKAWKMIYRLKREHPELLKGPNLSARVTIGETSYLLDGVETQKLVDYLPNIAREVAEHPRYHKYLRKRAAADLVQQDRDIKQIIEKYVEPQEEQ